MTIGGQETLDTAESIPESAWVLTRGAFESPLAPSRHVIGFERGIPVSLDGEALDPVALIERVEALAAPYGIGRGIHLGETILGIKGRVAFEGVAAFAAGGLAGCLRRGGGGVVGGGCARLFADRGVAGDVAQKPEKEAS